MASTTAPVPAVGASNAAPPIKGCNDTPPVEGIDWNDFSVVHGPESVREAFNSHPEIVVEEWPVPAEIARLDPVATFNPALLPEPFQAWAADVCRRNPYPIEYLATGALVVASSAIGRRLSVAVDGPESEFVVVPNLWGLAVGSPSAMKTPVLTEAVKPLRTLEREAEPQNEERMREFNRKAAITEESNKATRKKWPPP